MSHNTFLLGNVRFTIEYLSLCQRMIFTTKMYYFCTCTYTSLPLQYLSKTVFGKEKNKRIVGGKMYRNKVLPKKVGPCVIFKNQKVE
jgi:hypothetical protein